MMSKLHRYVRRARYSNPMMSGAVYAVGRLYRRMSGKLFEPEFALIPEFRIPAGRHFVDVGSNRGQTIDAILSILPTASIQSFEANPLLERFHKRHIQRPNVSIHYFGLGETEGSFDLLVPYYNGAMMDGIASLSEHEIFEFLEGGNFPAFNRSKLKIERVTCRLARLDDLGLEPGFIKLDVQGAEESALKGGAQTIASHRPVVLLESGPAPPQILLDLGYTQYSLRGDRLVQVRDAGDIARNSLYLLDEHKDAMADRLE